MKQLLHSIYAKDAEYKLAGPDDVELKKLWYSIPRNGAGHANWSSEQGRAMLRALQQSRRSGVTAATLAEALQLSVSSIYNALRRSGQLETSVDSLNIVGNHDEPIISLESIAQDIKRFARQHPSVHVEFATRMKDPE